MARENLIFICASLIIMQLVIVSSDDNIDWTTIHDELRKLAGNLRKKCTGETGATVDLLEEAEWGEFPDDDPDSKTKLGCYLRCVMEKGGVMKKDGTINFKLLSKMTPQAFKQVGAEMLDECRDATTGSDNCDIAYNFNKCMYNANPVAFLVI
ncbi:ObirObp11 [Ooceraea biroi]|uniref:ObirObp11 n=1 Tax=Ooceraea biroi TaxID=2015173 RepID=A0A026WQR8_OOCBI|nr:general odorant-binding protein 19d [Ooceraea biroi]EZA58375.1 hypothetical protein X777_01332 [Ooceraea biroi]RLU21418.1 ObirObp11 [Ooceraea biroi]